MKKLTTEEKAKAYDEAIERAKRMFSEKEVKYLFPALKESEDEKIRKVLRERIIRYDPNNEILIKEEGISQKQFLDWIERQGETFTKKDVDDAYLKGVCDAKHELEKQGELSVCNTPSRETILAIWELGNEWKELTGGHISAKYDTQLKYIQKHWRESEYYLSECYLREKQGEQKLVKCNMEWYDFVRWFVKERTNNYTLIPSDADIHTWGDIILKHAKKELEKQGEQKPTEWNPQPGDTFRKKGTISPTYHLCNKREDGITFGFVENNEVGISGGEITIFALRNDYELVERLKPIEKVIEEEFNKVICPNNAWSEEDEEIHRKCICAMRASACGFPEEEKFVEQVDNWLKSIKERIKGE